MSSPFHIAFAIDAGYSRQLRVLVASLLTCNKKEDLCLHVLHAKLSPRQETDLRLFTEKHQVTCRFHYIAQTRVKDLPVKMDYLSSVQYYRLFIPEFIPAHVSRVLYLDTDTMVCRNLAPLFNEDLHGCTVGAVEDLDVQASCERLGIPRSKGYFNSGVLLMDLPLWAQHNITAHVQKYLITHRNHSSKCKYPDQDALNTVLQETRHSLPLAWNAYACYRWFPPHELSPAQRAAITDPGIIHFTGPEKPWLANYSPPYRKQYQHYAQLAGIRFPFTFSLNAFRDRRRQEQRLRSMRKLHLAAGLRDHF